VPGDDVLGPRLLDPIHELETPGLELGRTHHLSR
jgi:hypothetical protein